MPDPRSVVMTFGRHTGRTLGDVERIDRGYVYWVAYQAERVPSHIRRAAREIASGAATESGTAISATYRVVDLPRGPSYPVRYSYSQRRRNDWVAWVLGIAIVAGACVFGQTIFGKPSTTTPQLQTVTIQRDEITRAVVPGVSDFNGGPSAPAPNVQLLFVDDFNGSLEYWNIRGPFHQTGRSSHSKPYSMWVGDERTGEYMEYLNTSMSMKVPVRVPVTGRTVVSWMWAGAFDTCGWDDLKVSLSANNGPWALVWRKCGERLGQRFDWQRWEVDLSQWRGQDVRVSFEMAANGYYQFEGAYIDDVRFEWMP